MRQYDNEIPQPTFQDYVKKLSTLTVGGVDIASLHKMRGTMEGEVVDDLGQVIPVGQEERGVFGNVAEHMAMATLITDILGEKLGLGARQRADVNTAAWIHDSGKKTERMWQVAIEEAESDPTSEFLTEESDEMSLVGARKKEALEQVSMMEEWENAEFGISPRVSRLIKENIPSTAEGHGEDLAAKIMWFADACLTGIKIQPIEQRFNDLESDAKNGERNIAFSNSFKERYHGKSLYEVQRDLGKKYIKEFSDQMGISSEDFYSWLNAQVNSRIQSQRMPLF